MRATWILLLGAGLAAGCAAGGTSGGGATTTVAAADHWRVKVLGAT